MRSALRENTAHPRVLDPELFIEESDLLAEAFSVLKRTRASK
jgi:hypothetical protein